MSKSKVTKRYVCNRYPKLAMTKGVKFVGGTFLTSDPAQIEVIESNDWFNVFIFDGGEITDDKEGIGGLPAVQPEEPGQSVGSGEEESRGSKGKGREASSIFQETEEVVKASGILKKKDYALAQAIDPKKEK